MLNELREKRRGGKTLCLSKAKFVSHSHQGQEIQIWGQWYVINPRYFNENDQC